VSQATVEAVRDFAELSRADV